MGAEQYKTNNVNRHRNSQRLGQVDMFFARLASLKQKQEKFSDEIKDRIIKDYLMLGGNETGDILKLNKKDKALFDACCWKHGINSAVFLSHIKEIKL